MDLGRRQVMNLRTTQRCFSLTTMASRNFVSLTTWFFQPEMGMTRYEVLSRASACPVRSRTAPNSSGLWTFLTSQHVTHPFRYPNYYNEPEHAFVHLLSDSDVRCTVEVRDGTSGKPLVVGHIHPFVLGSPRRDVSVAQFPDLSAQQTFLNAAAAHGHPLEELSLCASSPEEGAPLTVHGHVLQASQGGRKGQEQEQPQRGADASEDTTPDALDEDGHTLIPRSTRGHILVRSGRQVFAKTDTVLEMGMCGGPVLNEKGECVGVVEGVVPEAPTGKSQAVHTGKDKATNGEGISDKARAILAGCAVFVEVPELQQLLEESRVRTARMR